MVTGSASDFMLLFKKKVIFSSSALELRKMVFLLNAASPPKRLVIVWELFI